MIPFDQYRVESGQPAQLALRATSETGELKRGAARDMLGSMHTQLNTLQERLFAEGKQSLLVILQAMDTGGKDSTIREVLGALNPQGVRVWNFKAPTTVELQHDFLWRVHRRVPGHGYIGVFNRSHYEDVLIVRVHSLVPAAVWMQRYDHINAFEQLLHDAGTRVIKLFLHISKDYQRRRLQRRLDHPDRHWKFDPADITERARWDEYMHAYEKALTRCSTPNCPWYVIPAERRWYRDALVASILMHALEEMNPQYPRATFDPAKMHIE